MYQLPSQPNQPRSQAHDTYAMLQEAMRLPSQLSSVAEWLFEESERDFHVTDCKIPPEAFKYCSVLMSKSEFLAAAANGHPISRQQQEDAQSSLLMLQIPTKEVQGIFLGYTFSIGVPFDESLFPLRDAMSDTFCLVGRFAFDADNKQLLIYISDLSAKTSVIMQLDWIDTHYRRRRYFSIPNLDYSFYNLPSEVLGVTVNDEILQQVPPPPNPDHLNVYPPDHTHHHPLPSSPSAPQQSSSSSSPSPMPLAVAVDSQFANTNNHTSHNHHESWEAKSLTYADDVTELHPHLFVGLDGLDHNAHPSDGDVILEDRDPTDSSQNAVPLIDATLPDRDQNRKQLVAHQGNSLLHPHHLHRFLYGLAGVFTGTFFSPGVIRDMKTPLSSSRSATVAGQVQTLIRLADTKERTLIQDFAARAYFEATTAASNDRYFICLESPQEQEAKKREKQTWTSTGRS